MTWSWQWKRSISNLDDPDLDTTKFQEFLCQTTKQ